MTIEKKIFTLNNIQETVAFAHSLAKTLKYNSTVALIGDLGSGKTFIAREVIRFLAGENINVASPTFNLLQIYQCNEVEIYHFDLYRLKSDTEIGEIGLEEALGQKLCLIEWPAIIKDILPTNTILINIEITGENERRISTNTN